jgi:hypothetical protein
VWQLERMDAALAEAEAEAEGRVANDPRAGAHRHEASHESPGLTALAATPEELSPAPRGNSMSRCAFCSCAMRSASSGARCNPLAWSFHASASRELIIPVALNRSLRQAAAVFLIHRLHPSLFSTRIHSPLVLCSSSSCMRAQLAISMIVIMSACSCSWTEPEQAVGLHFEFCLRDRHIATTLRTGGGSSPACALDGGSSWHVAHTQS